MSLSLAGFLLLTLSVTPTNGSSDYAIRLLRSDIPHPEYEASATLAGKSIEAIFGPLSEVRVELDGTNKTDIDDDPVRVERRIRERLDRATCVGHEADVAWHQAPWAHGYVLLKDGRILPIQIMLSGIILGDLLFADPNGGVAP